jgi:nucleotide-binding universal stress UspA family protein
MPVDFSDRCMGMLPYAKAVAAKYNAELILLHIETDKELAKIGLDRFADLNVRRVLSDADPSEIITEFAKSEKIDLIAMPTRGYGLFRRFLIGSVTAKVLHDVTCPVLTGVHMESQAAASAAKFSNVLCAVDLGPQSGDALKWASQFATDFHGQLSVVHTVPMLTYGDDILYVADWMVELRNVGRQNVEKLLGSTGVTAAAVHIQEGDPAAEVCSLAERMKADLLVIGRGPQDGKYGRLTTHAYGIIRQSPCPVISI